MKEMERDLFLITNYALISLVSYREILIHFNQRGKKIYQPTYLINMGH